VHQFALTLYDVGNIKAQTVMVPTKYNNQFIYVKILTTYHTLPMCTSKVRQIPNIKLCIHYKKNILM